MSNPRPLGLFSPPSTGRQSHKGISPDRSPPNNHKPSAPIEPVTIEQSTLAEHSTPRRVSWVSQLQLVSSKLEALEKQGFRQLNIHDYHHSLAERTDLKPTSDYTEERQLPRYDKFRIVLFEKEGDIYSCTIKALLDGTTPKLAPIGPYIYVIVAKQFADREQPALEIRMLQMTTSGHNLIISEHELESFVGAGQIHIADFDGKRRLIEADAKTGRFYRLMDEKKIMVEPVVKHCLPIVHFHHYKQSNNDEFNEKKLNEVLDRFNYTGKRETSTGKSSAEPTISTTASSSHTGQIRLFDTTHSPQPAAIPQLSESVEKQFANMSMSLNK